MKDMFESIIGQKKIRRFLQRTFEGGRVSHAYLFVGEQGVGKEAAALEFAKQILCGIQHESDQCTTCARVGKVSHPDLDFVFPAPAKVKEEDHRTIISSIVEDPYLRSQPWANPTISIDRIREIRKKASFKSFEGKGRVFVLADCERMTTEASNSLLKILEEPPDGMYLIMTSSRPSLLLPTITSRCQVIKFDPLRADEIRQTLIDRHGIANRKAAFTARLADGSYRRAMELLGEDLHTMQATALEFFRKTIQNDYVQQQYVDELLATYNKDAKRVKELLSFLLLWFRDAMVYREVGRAGQEDIIHQDEVEVLEKFTSSFPQAELGDAVIEIENALELIDRNVQVNLILTVLLSRLRKYIRR